MAIFKNREDLPRETRDELSRIEAITSTKRSTTEANFLAALLPYSTNRVLRWDTTQQGVSSQNTLRHLSGDLILEAEGVPA